jgi:mannose-6-phosphate isomerase
MTSSQPVRLTPAFHERVWGVSDLAPWFPAAGNGGGRKLGEAWFTAQPPLPILVKFLFTSANLSVQVHPDGENGIGKTEMWHILRCDPGARIALGFTAPIAGEALRTEALTGGIEQRLRWIPVSPGQTYFIPAGTVHAIGAGITICEIQQNSDITYRLYDYGRPRELHLDQGVAATDLNAWRHPGASVEVDLADGWKRLARCRHFATDSLNVKRAHRYQPDSSRFELLICVNGEGRLNSQEFAAGDVWLLPAGGSAIELSPAATLSLLRSYVPSPDA